MLVEEARLEIRIVLEFDPKAETPLEHLANEGRIEEAIMEAGRAATEVLFQRRADQYNELASYRTPAGSVMRQVYQNLDDFGSPYGPIHVRRSHFYNDHLGEGESPFERETRMEEHRLTPMMQFQALQLLAEKGPEAAAKDFKQQRGVAYSHHLLDEFLEDQGAKYERLRPELVKQVLDEDWKPTWRPCLWKPELVAKEPGRGEPAGTEGNSPALGEDHPPGRQEPAPTIPVVQLDAMTVTVRKYQCREKDGKENRQKYTTERHQLHNAVVGTVRPEGPRAAGDKISLHQKRYFSEYRDLGAVARAAHEYAQSCGLEPGATVLCYGDGAPTLWDEYATHFQEYHRIEILDERHCRKNLRLAAEVYYPGQNATQTAKQRGWVTKRLDELYQGEYAHFFHALNYVVKAAPSEEAAAALRTRRNYFRTHQQRIRYKDFLDKGYPISTCFVESAHNHVIGDRVRNNGRTYRPDRLQWIAHLRCEYKSNRLPYVFQRLIEMEPQHTL